MKRLLEGTETASSCIADQLPNHSLIPVRWEGVVGRNRGRGGWFALDFPYPAFRASFSCTCRGSNWCFRHGLFPFLRWFLGLIVFNIHASVQDAIRGQRLSTDRALRDQVLTFIEYGMGSYAAVNRHNAPGFGTTCS